jgi:hypothetical protein
MPFRSIPAPADPNAPYLVPPCSGNWRRLPDGALIPDDEATARSAGLFDEETPET